MIPNLTRDATRLHAYACGSAADREQMEANSQNLSAAVRRNDSDPLVHSSISQTVVKGATCNTPPLNTRGNLIPEENRILIDWFEFTMPDEFRLQDRYLSLKTYLRYEGASFRNSPRGMNGYKSQIIYGKAKILLDGSEGMGVHVILCGEAIRQMRGDILQLLHWILHHGGKVSRIDLALYDVSGQLTLSRVKKSIRAGAVTCRAKDYRRMEKGSLSTGKVNGETIYFGSAQSKTQYRIYDKAAEQGVEGHWVRCEGQYRHENAQKGFSSILCG